MTEPSHLSRSAIFHALSWASPDQVSASARKTRELIRNRFDALEAMMTSAQESNQQKLDTLTDSVNTGVQELRDEIAKQATAPPEQVDFSRLQALADALAGDNIPAPAEPTPPTEPAPEPTPTPEPPAA